MPETGSAIGTGARPRLAPKVRLRWDRKDGRYMLLYPERGLVLNATAADGLSAAMIILTMSVGLVVPKMAIDYFSDRWGPGHFRRCWPP